MDDVKVERVTVERVTYCGHVFARKRGECGEVSAFVAFMRTEERARPHAVIGRCRAHLGDGVAFLAEDGEVHVLHAWTFRSRYFD